MVEAPTDAVPQILIKIQDSISALRSDVGTLRSDVGTLRSEVGTFRSEMGQFRTSVEGRLDRLEQLNHKYRRDAAAMMVIMRATAGDFDERVNEVVERVAALEARTS
jgi:methyl-accepting chemotaxis protein